MVKKKKGRKEVTKKTTAAYIVYNSKILLILRDDIPTIHDPNTWDVPGGGCEEDETFKEGMTRELKEELDLEIDESRLVFLWELETFTNKIEHSFLVKIDNNEKTNLVLKEGQEMRFFKFDELYELELTRLLDKVFNEKRNELVKIFE